MTQKKRGGRNKLERNSRIGFAPKKRHADSAVGSGSKPFCTVVTDSSPGLAAKHGLHKIMEALQAKGIAAEQVTTLEAAQGNILIVTGLASGYGAAANLLHTLNITAPTESEALVIRHTQWNGKPILLVSGSDERGLMYAQLDVAERIGWAEEEAKPFSEIKDTIEKPAVEERALSKLVMNKSEFEQYFFSEEYWARYLDMLAQNRYSTFVLMFGWGSAGYFDPPYPFLFDVSEFPEVRVVGITKEEQKRNLDALNQVIQMTHDRGLSFTLALWTHIYRGIKEPTPGLVWGLTDDNLISYTKAAFTKFLKLVPELDAIQFRVHIESSVALPQQIPFWNAVYKVIKDSGKDIRVDIRVKGFTDDMIDSALASGVRIRMTTKYWGEQMGLPFHPTHLTGRNQFKRRHSYADLLRYPRQCRMHYRLWNLGTTRILLWGNPEYVRRFTESTYLWDGEGYEVSEPLAFKMGNHRGETYELLKPEYQYYDWEFERYWHFFQVFGLIGYNPDTSPRVWQEEFEKRFGKEAASYIEQALHKASQILPRIVAYNLSDLSAGHAWAEKQRWNDLSTYAMSEPSDTAQFLGIEEAARYHLQSKESPLIWPQQTSDWFADVSKEVFELVEKAEEHIDSHKNKEFISTMIDLKVLAFLARYHSQRIHAGLNWSFFKYSKELNAFVDAIKWERQAIETWENIVQLTDGVYDEELIMGGSPRMTGGWKYEAQELKKGLEKLEQQYTSFQPEYRKIAAKFDFGDGALEEVASSLAEEGFLPVRPDTRYNPLKGGYGWLHSHLSPSPTWRSERVDRASEQYFVHGPEPMRYTYSAFAADMPNGHYELTFSMVDMSVEPRDYGPMWIVANGMDSTERFVVVGGQRVEKTLNTTVTDNRLNVVFNCVTNAKWLVNSMIVTRLEPTIAHIPIRKVTPGKDIVIRATINGPDSLTHTRVVYGSLKQGYTYVSMERTAPYLYRAVIPNSAVVDGMAYFIESVDEAGRRATFPRDGSLYPIRVMVTDDNEPPIVSHTPIRECTLGKPLKISAKVRDSSGVKWVRLRYRGVNQHQDYHTQAMLPTGENDRYQAEIPTEHIRQEWDLMYFIEVMDNYGNGKIYPELEEKTPYVVVRVQREENRM